MVRPYPQVRWLDPPGTHPSPTFETEVVGALGIIRSLTCSEGWSKGPPGNSFQGPTEGKGASRPQNGPRCWDTDTEEETPERIGPHVNQHLQVQFDLYLLAEMSSFTCIQGTILPVVSTYFFVLSNRDPTPTFDRELSGASATGPFDREAQLAWSDTAGRYRGDPLRRFLPGTVIR